jgi:hypothetical protein
MLSVSFAALLAAGSAAAQQVRIDADDIGGVVTGANGPEAGVWVIAETRDLPTKYVKIVATDDQGRYVLPDLPKANYDVWVRGYGLIDSPKQKTAPGKNLDLKAVAAPNRAAAAVSRAKAAASTIPSRGPRNAESSASARSHATRARPGASVISTLGPR